MPVKLNNHKANPANDLIEIVTQDAVGAGGAYHAYGIYWPTYRSGIACIAMEKIRFQNGPIKENGVNGLTQEVLLAIVQHRLECFQAGPYANEYNREALDHVTQALVALHSRTLERQSRGVEGTNQK